MNWRSVAIGSACCVVLGACAGDEASGGGTGTTGSTGVPTTTEDGGATTVDGGATTGDSNDAVDSESGPSATESTSAATQSDDSSGGGSSESTGGGSGSCADTWPQWDDGTDCGNPPIQVHQVSDNTVILRQSLCTNFEAPFMYMFFGTQRVLLEDTGAGGIALSTTVYGIIDDWLAANGQESIELIVVNSHAHGDHTQGNSMFQGMPNTQVVGTGVGNVSAFFGIGDWPNQSVEYDLGGRVLDIIPIPGHESSHIAIYDHGENWLLTGDTLYPGRLYISNFPAYVESINRLVDHVAGREVCNVMGTHIEMTNTPGVDFPFGAITHPNERPLALTVDHLVELRDGVEAMAGAPMIEAHDDFIIYPF